jgi:hypothetical protein
MKGKRWIILSIIAIFAILLSIPFPRQMEDSFVCHVLDQEDESYSDQVTVTFSGTYSDYLIRQDKFVGRISIEGYEFMSPRSTDITLSIGYYEETFVYNYINYVPTIEIHYLGTLYACEDLDSFFLWLLVPDEDDPSTSHGRYFRREASPWDFVCRRKR